MHEEEDLWMAPGIINAYCKVTDVSQAETESEERSSLRKDTEEDNDFTKKSSISATDEEEENDSPPEQEKGSDGEKSDGEEEGDDESDDDDDEDEKKPRSFGKVAMMVPEEQRNDIRASADANRASLPTMFASLSLVAQMAVKQVVESSISSA